MKKKLIAGAGATVLLIGGVDLSTNGAPVQPMPDEVSRTTRTVTQSLGDNHFVTTSYMAPKWEKDRKGKWHEIRVPYTKKALRYIVDIAEAADTGFKTTGNIVLATNWTNLDTTHINTSDNSYATIGVAASDGRMNNFSFGIPAGATIDGIELTAEAKMASFTFAVNWALSWNNGTTFTSNKSQTWTTTEQTFTSGGPADTWGHSWTDTELADGTFLVKNTSTGSAFNPSLDFLQVKVYYTGGGGGTTAIDPEEYEWFNLLQ